MATTMQEVMRPMERDPRFPRGPAGWSPGEAERVFERNENVRVRELHDALDERFHARGGIRYLYELFPGGPIAQGCRLAGLTPPAGAEDRSFGSVQ